MTVKTCYPVGGSVPGQRAARAIIRRLPLAQSAYSVGELAEIIDRETTAPELLAACKSAASWFGELGNDDGAQGLLDDLRAAIVKATA